MRWRAPSKDVTLENRSGPRAPCTKEPLTRPAAYRAAVASQSGTSASSTPSARSHDANATIAARRSASATRSFNTPPAQDAVDRFTWIPRQQVGAHERRRCRAGPRFLDERGAPVHPDDAKPRVAQRLAVPAGPASRVDHQGTGREAQRP